MVDPSHSSRVNIGAEGLLDAVGGTAQARQGWMRLERAQIAFALTLTHIFEPQARMEKAGSVFCRAVRLRVGF